MTEQKQEEVELRSAGPSGAFVLRRDRRGKWRAYYRETVTSYTDSNFHQWSGAHDRYYALRDADTGKPLPPLPDRAEMERAVLEALDNDDILPWG